MEEVFHVANSLLLILNFYLCLNAGNAASLLLYAAPILTFRRVTKKRSTGKFSCIPYLIALLNCLLYTWYGFPVVSSKWENLPLVTINGLGILFEASFIFIYLRFAPAEQKASFHLCLLTFLLFSVSS
ncbi:bidirectional sugar transporter SWEET3-like [Canna indica]|uniref:Bidirectional sugar transporter SWEET3-like n=1 Tax=Canna indica TaxID=4628 RepID=A0AAQ3JW05_9LILI|nr:bidirectional sugar transporter SWEET3-like [Canna indica]